MAITKVGIIDDGYPVMDEKIFTLNDIKNFIETRDWGYEDSLKELNAKLTIESTITNNKIHIEGYNHPETYIKNNRFDDDFLIYDWEYKPSCESHEILFEILNLTDSKIFIFSAYNNLDNIPNILNEDRFIPFLKANRYEIRNKSEDEDIEIIINEIKEKYKKGEIVKWNGLDLTIKPSRYIIDSDDFWKLLALIGKENILSYFEANKTSTIDETTILNLFACSTFQFFIDKNKSIISISNNELITNKFGELQAISMINALTIFGLDKLEETREKGFSKIK